MSFKIEKNIPIPDECKKRSCKYPFRLMEVGDSFLVEPKQGESPRDTQTRVLCASRNYKNMRFRTKVIEDEGIRCWRVE